MKKRPALHTLFHRSQLLTSAIVALLTGLFLISLQFVFTSYLQEKRILSLARSIESHAHIAKSPRYLQHALNSMIYSNNVKGIVVLSKDDLVIAASGGNSSDTQQHWLPSDHEFRKFIAKTVKTGKFGTSIQSHDGHTLSIFPLAPPATKPILRLRSKLTQLNTPDWHKYAQLPELSPSQMFKRLTRIVSGQSKKQFTLKPNQFTGAIIVESSDRWIARLALRTFILLTALMMLGLLIVNVVLAKSLKRHVLSNIKPFIDNIKARKSGNIETRVTGITTLEFDELAKQWNSLLDYRKSSQSQSMVLSSLLEHAPVGIKVCDSTSHIEYANPAFLKLTGLSLIEVIGKTTEQILPNTSPPPRTIANAVHELSDGQSWSGEVTAARPDQDFLHCHVTVVPIFDQNQKTDRIITLYHDISKIMGDQHQLEIAKVSAELADKSKSEFIANMSHELRTPLNAIIGFSELMGAQKLGPMGNEEYVEFSKLIENSSRSLLSTINTILELSRLDSDTHNLDQQTISAARVIDKVINTKTDKSRALGVEIQQNLDLDLLVHTDENYLRQSIAYLICNAIKYNRPTGGTVMVTSYLNDTNQFVISIKDNGIGISAKNITKIMSPFHRVDNGLSRAKDGAGLGLTLVKKFAKAQDIELAITSELNEGTTATLTFDAADTRQRKPPAQVTIKQDVA